MSNIIPTQEINGERVITSEQMAIELGVAHKNHMELVNKHREAIESMHGEVAFQTRLNKTGTPTKVYHYTEDQAIAVAVLARNSDQAVAVKLRISYTFSQLKKAVQGVAVPGSFADALQLAADQQRRIEAMEPLAELGAAMSQVEAMQLREWISMLKSEGHTHVKERATLTRLCDAGYLYRKNTRGGKRLRAYAQYDDLFVLKAALCADGRMRETLHITGKGIETLYHLVIQH